MNIDQILINIDFRYHTGLNTDKQDIVGRTLLYIACEKDLRGFAAKRIQLVVDVTKQTIFGMTPLHLAAASGSAKIVVMLQQSQKININAKDINGCTPLHYAHRHQHFFI